MASRQDRPAWAEQRRAASALATGDGDGRIGPDARTVLVSVLLAVLGIGGAAAWAQLAGGPPEGWRDGGVLVVEQETGARLVWRDGALHPVPNFTSAQLILQRRAPRIVAVPRAVLTRVPRGAPLGLPDAPESLPAPADLSTGPWSVCSDGVTPGAPPRSMLLAGAEPGGGEGLGERALLVREPDGTLHLIWRGHRHRLSDPGVALPALGWAGRSPLPVAPAPLAALPAGPELGPLEIPGRGQPSVALPGAVIGQVFVVTGRAGRPQYAIALRGGLAPLTAVQVDLVLTDPRTVAAVGQRVPVPLSQAEYASLPRLDAGAVGGTGLPAVVPALAEVTGPGSGAGSGAAGADHPVVCAVVAGRDGAVEVLLNPVLPPVRYAVPAGGAGAADLVVVPPGGGVLVRDGDGVSVVSGLGRRHPVDPRVRELLGYGQAAPVELPAAVVSLVPAGAALDPDRAAATVSGLSTGERSGLPLPGAGD
jgi:type VII secretion protein EccB